MTYQRKPIEVEAFRWNMDEVPDWFTAAQTHPHKAFEQQFGAGTIFVPIAGGTLQATPGDWIILEPNGSMTVTDNATFEQSYSEVE